MLIMNRRNLKTKKKTIIIILILIRI